MKRIVKLLIAFEKWCLENCIGKEDAEYEKYSKIIEEHERKFKMSNKFTGVE